MATAAPDLVDRPSSAPTPSTDIALLGLGQIGAAVARGLLDSPSGLRLRIVGALVRNAARVREVGLPSTAVVTTDAGALFARRPSVVIELLGGVQPALTLVTYALANGIAVVTANKSLLAAHGPELAALSARTGVPLFYEASVLAGVPFLGALSRRPHAAGVTRITGIVNGTSNHILTAMRARGVELGAALLDAQSQGLAEPNPRKDVNGTDAVEKLSVLLQHFGWGHAAPGVIETVGIGDLQAADIAAAQQLGGVLKPIIFAERLADHVKAFVGPAFVPWDARLARVDGAENALALRNGYGELFYAGPGAGPAATAATVLDDVFEITRNQHRRAPAAHDAEQLTPARPCAIAAPESGWFVRLTSASRLPSPETVADLLGAHGLWLRRTLPDVHATWALTWGAPRTRVERALAALTSASGCEASAIRALEG